MSEIGATTTTTTTNDTSTTTTTATTTATDLINNNNNNNIDTTTDTTTNSSPKPGHHHHDNHHHQHNHSNSGHVEFSPATSPTGDELPIEKEATRFLTAKYPKHQMGLIRKRLAVEDWMDEQLRTLYDFKDTDIETCEPDLDLDEIIDLESDTERYDFIKDKLSIIKPCHESKVDAFIDDLITKINNL